MTIKQKQCLLFYLGYYTGNVDGTWGTLSKTATRAFQQDYFQMESKVDGVCGTETEKALKHAVCYGMPAKNVTDTNTGTFWDDIKYFTPDEFTCRCGCGAGEMNEKLIRNADKVREHFNAPITVSSGRRCPTHNSRVGGVSNSRHMSGNAMDFCVKGKSSATVLAYVQTLSDIAYAYAIDSSYVHMDVK